MIYSNQSQVKSMEAFGSEQWRRSNAGLYVPAGYRRRYSRPVAIDLFAGCGGFSCGIMQGGFQVVAAVENEEWATITYTHNLCSYPMQFHFDNDESRARLENAMDKAFKMHGKEHEEMLKNLEVRNNPELKAELELYQPVLAGHGYIASMNRANPGSMDGCEHFFFGDIRNFTGQQILDAVGLGVGDVDLIVGGPPCQGFSRAGKRNVYDPRNSMVFEFAQMVVEIKPKTICMENVTDMMTMIMPDGRSVVAAFAQALSDGGYAAHESITRSLLGDKNARVVVREDYQKSGKRKSGEPVEESEQLTLFG